MIGRRITPSMVVAALALFAALGGSAFAIGTKSAKLGCAAGAAKAYVTFDADHFVGSFPQSFSNTTKLWARRYTCNGRAPEARGTSGGIEIRFPGVPAGAPIVSVMQSTGGFVGDDHERGDLPRSDVGSRRKRGGARVHARDSLATCAATLRWRPRSSADRAVDFESTCGGSTPPGAT
jgi:hypothetical protein